MQIPGPHRVHRHEHERVAEVAPPHGDVPQVPVEDEHDHVQTVLGESVPLQVAPRVVVHALQRDALREEHERVPRADGAQDVGGPHHGVRDDGEVGDGLRREKRWRERKQRRHPERRPEQNERPVAEVLHPVRGVQDVLVAQVVQHEEHREREDREAPEPEREPAAEKEKRKRASEGSVFRPDGGEAAMRDTVTPARSARDATRSRRARASARRVWTGRDSRERACHRATRPRYRVPGHAELPVRRAHPRGGHRPVSCGVLVDVVHRERHPQHHGDQVRGEDGGRPLLRGALHHLGVGGDVVVHRVHRERHARARVCPADRPLSSRRYGKVI